MRGPRLTPLLALGLGTGFVLAFNLAHGAFTAAPAPAREANAETNTHPTISNPRPRVTVSDASSRAFGQSMPGLPVRDRGKFAVGNRLFNTNWVTAPASVQSLDGLGPLFNRVSCSACHTRDGRGKAPAGPNEPLTSALVRLSIQTPDGQTIPHPVYGDQLQDRAIQGATPEAKPQVKWTPEIWTYPDGQTVTLRRPSFRLKEPGYGPFGEGLLTSLRVAPAVHGSGLLEAIPEVNILRAADPDDRNNDGISGRPNLAWDAGLKTHRLGRFGWKANIPTLRQQNAAAAHGDVGLTSPMFPEPGLTDQQLDRLQPHVDADQQTGATDLTDKQLDHLTFYVRHLAVPEQRNADHASFKLGQQLFNTIGCASCHTPAHTTGTAFDLRDLSPLLAEQTIYPYTDLLLHDMGPDLADGRPDEQANGQEWRTPPLWGLGLTHIVRSNGRPPPPELDANGQPIPPDFGLLHDGRARTFEEAILWHGGEAEAAREHFNHLTAEERRAVLFFLESI